MQLQIALPAQELPEAYFNLRYEVLRQPLGAEPGAEKLSDDHSAIHAWIEDQGRIVSVGRVHLLSANDDGSAFDEKAQSACPAFQPLTTTYHQMLDDNGKNIPKNPRPACQFRQMGTHKDFRGKRLSSQILRALENEAKKLWNAHSGWLQARTAAIPFYQNNNWVCFGTSYIVPNVGLHRSMWKTFL